MNELLTDKRKLGAWAGMLAPILFVGVFTIEGWLRPGYEPFKMFVSELSLGARGWIQMTNFVITGFLFLLFARGVKAEFKDGKASRGGPVLLGIIGFSLLVSGPLVMDPASTPRVLWSLHGTLHQLFGALVFSLAPISVFVFWRRFRIDPKWRSLSAWTLIVGLILVVAVVLLRIPAVPPAPPNSLNPWVGLIQRAALIPYHAWIFTFALALYRRLKIK